MVGVRERAAFQGSWLQRGQEPKLTLAAATSTLGRGTTGTGTLEDPTFPFQLLNPSGSELRFDTAAPGGIIGPWQTVNDVQTTPRPYGSTYTAAEIAAATDWTTEFLAPPLPAVPDPAWPEQKWILTLVRADPYMQAAFPLPY